VGFSTGGSECTLGDVATSFAAGVPIHTVLTMEPALPTGGTVQVTVEKDGVELVDARQTITLDEPAPCIWGAFPELEAGHYRITYAISPSSLPPVSGEFDVTPFASASDAPTRAPDPSLARRIIGRLDDLEALAAREDELLTAEWAIDEADWVTESMEDLLDQGGTLERYVDEVIALIDVVAEGADPAEAIGRLLSLRDELAAESALPTAAATPPVEP
jgi:hypothetical protein